MSLVRYDPWSVKLTYKRLTFYREKLASLIRFSPSGSDEYSIIAAFLNHYMFEPKQKYLANKSDEPDDDVSDCEGEEDYGVQTYNPYNLYNPGAPDL